MNRIIVSFAIAILAGLLTLGALEVGWQAAYNNELAARESAYSRLIGISVEELRIRAPPGIIMVDWSPAVKEWITPPVYPFEGGFRESPPPYPEPLGAIYGR